MSHCLTLPINHSSSQCHGDQEEMASTTLASFTILSLLLLTASSCVSAQLYEAFLQCFLNKTNSSSSASSSRINTPHTPSFYAIYNTTIQNLRFASTFGAMKMTFIVTLKNSFDVQAVVICVKASGLHLKVRIGSYDYEARFFYSAGDPFVIHDLTNIRSITVDAVEGTARVNAGAMVSELYYNINTQTNKDTVAFPMSLCTIIGIGRIIGGGRLSTLLKKYGTLANNIVDASIVDVNSRMLDQK